MMKEVGILHAVYPNDVKLSGPAEDTAQHISAVRCDDNLTRPVRLVRYECPDVIGLRRMQKCLRLVYQEQPSLEGQKRNTDPDEAPNAISLLIQFFVLRHEGPCIAWVGRYSAEILSDPQLKLLRHGVVQGQVQTERLIY